jgi:molecular chaperone IbpA
MRRLGLYPITRDFGTLFDTFQESAFKADTSYPVYNTFKIDNPDEINADSKSFIEIAVTGLSEKDIKAYFDEDNYLVIEGKYPEEDRTYFHRGLSRKDFKRKFELGKNVEVKNITVKNGILIVELQDNIPETKLIPINTQDANILEEKPS